MMSCITVFLKNTIHVPPLRTDKELLRKLIVSRIKFYKEKYKKETLTIEPQAMEMLETYSWPGNRRELDKILDSIVSLNDGRVAASALAQFSIGNENRAVKPLLICDMEMESISALLASNMSKEEAARTLGISRATLYRKIKKFNLCE